LQPPELARAERFIKPSDRDRFILCRGLLRQTLGSKLNRNPATIDFHRNEQGKPYLPDNDLQFNMSHSRDRLLIAVTHKRAVGVDIEFRRKGVPMDAIAERWFAPQEIAFFQASEDSQHAFFDIWSRKEAYVKALGKGIFQDLTSFSVPLGEPPNVPILGTIDGWAFQGLEIDPAYSAALVWQDLLGTPPPKVRLITTPDWNL
jgi:4'-phosphopantetheinyl transferase